MFRNVVVLTAACCGILASSVSEAAQIVVGASEDATIFQNPANNASGAGNGLFAGNNGQNSPRRGLIGFDIAGSLPANAVIQDVKLTLVLGQVAGSGQGTGSGSKSIAIHRVMADWNEGATLQSSPATDSLGGQGTGAMALAGDVTWNSRVHGATMWSNAGGDFDATPSAATSVGTAVNSGFVWTSPSMVSEVQAWLDNPSSNFGWLLKGDESAPTSFRAFYSSDVATASLRPQLEITYTTVPEPMSVAMCVTVGAVALAARRKGRLPR